MVVEGIPLRQEYWFAAGSYSPSVDEDNSPPLLWGVEPCRASAAAFNPDDVAAALVEILASSEQITANERLRNRDYDTNMATLGGCLSRFEQIFSEVRDSIDIVWAESVSLVALNSNTRTVVCNSMANFLRAIEVSEQQNAITEQKNVNALAAYEQRVKVMAEVHTKSIVDMQAKLQSSFDRMKYLEKMFQNVPGLVKTHLEDRLPAILTNVVGKALAPALTTVLTECPPPTMTEVLWGSLADFQSHFGAAGGADSTLRVRELLQTAAALHSSDHSAVVTAIEGIGARLSALDDVIAMGH